VPTRRDDVTALVLAGGRATRLGGAIKHELVIDGEAIFARQHAVLAPRVHEILIASPVDVAGARCVRDAVEGGGPLAGIAAGLAAMTTPWLLVVAGDMPWLHGPSIDLLLDATKDGLDAIGVRINNLPEPLFCVVHARARPAIDRRLAAARYKASELLTDSGLEVAWIHERELRALDPELRGLRDIDEPSDLPTA
jgi:molybdopterin-guanine dinucleotide biosynthesis protein A